MQDLEGDCRNTVVLFLMDDLAALRREVAHLFGYKQACCLFTRFGASIEDITLIRDEDTLCSTGAAGCDLTERIPGVVQRAS